MTRPGLGSKVNSFEYIRSGSLLKVVGVCPRNIYATTSSISASQSTLLYWEKDGLYQAIFWGSSFAGLAYCFILILAFLFYRCVEPPAYLYMLKCLPFRLIPLLTIVSFAILVDIYPAVDSNFATDHVVTGLGPKILLTFASASALVAFSSLEWLISQRTYFPDRRYRSYWVFPLHGMRFRMQGHQRILRAAAPPPGAIPTQPAIEHPGSHRNSSSAPAQRQLPICVICQESDIRPELRKFSSNQEFIKEMGEMLISTCNNVVHRNCAWKIPYSGTYPVLMAQILSFISSFRQILWDHNKKDWNIDNLPNNFRYPHRKSQLQPLILTPDDKDQVRRLKAACDEAWVAFNRWDHTRQKIVADHTIQLVDMYSAHYIELDIAIRKFRQFWAAEKAQNGSFGRVMTRLAEYKRSLPRWNSPISAKQEAENARVHGQWVDKVMPRVLMYDLKMQNIERGYISCPHCRGFDAKLGIKPATRNDGPRITTETIKLWWYEGVAPQNTMIEKLWQLAGFKEHLINDGWDVRIQQEEPYELPPLDIVDLQRATAFDNGG